MIWIVGYGAFSILACLLTVAAHDINKLAARYRVWTTTPEADHGER